MRRANVGELIGTSIAMATAREEIERIARSDAKVLITGESGVGKELVAREIHARSLRANRVFVPVNCAGLPETLLESELFGHVKGSFPGAYGDKAGKLEMAHEGTMFLDEVGEMTLRMQGLLLRFLQTGELQKVGSERVGGTAIWRFIAATNKPLIGLIAQGLFREDLFYRLNVIHLIVPPLRRRRDDISDMIDQFLRRFMASNQSPVTSITPEATAMLAQYEWPGNVRQLENVIERLVVIGRGAVVGGGVLPLEVRVPRRARGVGAPPPIAPARHVNVVDD